MFIAPLLAIFAGFYLWPALVTVLSSFFEWGLLRPWSLAEPDRWDFVGLDNYSATLTDPSFWNAALNTAIWLVVFPLLVAAFSLLVSILVWYVSRGGAVFRTMFVLPMTISLAAAGVIWSFVYNPDPQVGMLNAVLDRLGILGATGARSARAAHRSVAVRPRPARSRLRRDPADEPGADHPGVLGVQRLRRHPLTAGLTAVSYELVEAAKVDGANPWQVARHVLIPALRGPLVVVGSSA